MLADLEGFMHAWAAQAHALRWTTLDLFGCHPTAPDRRHDYMGVCWFLRDKEIVAFDEATITLRTRSGSIQAFRRHIGALPGRVAIWDLGPEAG